MNYNEFMEHASGHIKEYLPPEYQDAKIRLDTVQKTNEQYTGMTVRLAEDVASPVVNMKTFYENLEAGDSLDHVMREMAGVLQMQMPRVMDIDVLKDYEKVKDQLFIRLSPVEGNETFLEDGPHQMAEDMLMTYHIYMPGENGDFMSARITNQIMEDYGISPEQLHRDAIASTGRLFEPKIQSMMEALTGIPEEEPQMMIVTNTHGTLGAGALFCEGIMDKAAEMMKGNYFVLPSSQHEFIIVPDNGDFNRADLENMVRQANETVVEPVDRLSDQVYHYDQKDRLFERADAFEKRTREKAAERGSVLGKLQAKKDQIERNAPIMGKDKQRQAGLAI